MFSEASNPATSTLVDALVEAYLRHIATEKHLAERTQQLYKAF